MNIEDQKRAEKFYIESDINGIHTPSKNTVEINYLDMVKLMHEYAQQQLKNFNLQYVKHQSELLLDFMNMIEEGGMIKFDKPKLLHQFKNKQCDIHVVSSSYDSKKCEKCGGRTALVKGSFYYDADAEPYNGGIEEEANISGECWVGGFICDDCNNIQGLWHE